MIEKNIRVFTRDNKIMELEIRQVETIDFYGLDFQRHAMESAVALAARLTDKSIVEIESLQYQSFMKLSSRIANMIEKHGGPNLSLVE